MNTENTGIILLVTAQRDHIYIWWPALASVWAAWVLESKRNQGRWLVYLKHNYIIEYSSQFTLNYIGTVLLSWRVNTDMIEVVLNDRLGKKARTLLSFGDANDITMIFNVCLCGR